MATLVSAAAGAALGGSIGTAVGRFAGRQIDRSFGASPARRLSDLRLPSAQYGDPIPGVVGRMRVAGVVLWVSKPVATAVVSKTGSSQSQSVSFALAVSSTRIDEIGRIWADGRLIRDGEGQQNVAFTVRLHDGNEDQSSDGLIAAVEGEALTPAYRGVAYLVFENFDLSTFGNRLPLITAEVSSGGQLLTAERMLQERLGLATGTRDATSHLLHGAAIWGDDAVEALSPFVEAAAPSFSFDVAGWSMGNDPRHHLIEPELWASQHRHEEGGGRLIDSPSRQPTRVSVRYFDPAIEFATGEKSARLPGPEKLLRIELPAAMDGEVAKALAFSRLAGGQRKEVKWLQLPVSFAHIRVGDHVSAEDAPDSRWRVREKRMSVTGVTLKLSGQAQPVGQQEVEAGGVAMPQRLTLRRLSVDLIELPGVQSADQLGVAVLVTGGTSPYQQVPVSLSIAGATTNILSSPAEGARGQLIEELPPAPSEIIDSRSSLTIRFANDPLLTSCDRAALIAGANLMWIGGEFVQFGSARPVQEGVYLLTDLLRGRFGSEVNTPHPLGTSAILLDPHRFCFVGTDVNSIGSEISAEVRDFDGTVSSSRLLVEGRAAKPWRPAHLKVDETGQELRISWVRRSRSGALWLDFVDAPLGFAQETYVVSIESSDGKRVEQVVSQPNSQFDQRSLDQLGPRPWTVEVFQVGDLVAGDSSRILI